MVNGWVGRWVSRVAGGRVVGVRAGEERLGTG